MNSKDSDEVLKISKSPLHYCIMCNKEDKLYNLSFEMSHTSTNFSVCKDCFKKIRDIMNKYQIEEAKNDTN